MRKTPTAYPGCDFVFVVSGTWTTDLEFGMRDLPPESWVDCMDRR